MRVRWIWVFVDAPEPAEETWAFWRAVARARESPRRGERDQFVTLLPALGDPWVKLQAVRSGGGVHLDVDVDDVPGAAREAAGLGATEVTRFPQDAVVVMRSPGGFVFCLTRWHGEVRQVRGGEPDLIDQVCLDVPSAAHEAEAAFWAALLGQELVTPPGRPELPYLVRPRGLPLRMLVQRLGGGDGPVTGHLDLACADRVATRAAHEALGARHVREGARWSVMADPAGRAYCLTDRDPATGQLPD